MRLIDDLLDLARIEAGSTRWNVAPFALTDALEHVASGLAPLAARKKIEVVVEAGADLPRVLGDRDRVIQVVTNLLGNALKFTPDGGRIRIAAKLSHAPATGRAPHGFLEVGVTDSGGGIDPADQAVIFERFRQAGDVLRGKPRGTGLGLPISREIVEHLGGRMWLASEPGKGSVFAFTVPTAAPLPNLIRSATDGPGKESPIGISAEAPTRIAA
jgi:signal transduction histidine kinase